MAPPCQQQRTLPNRKQPEERASNNGPQMHVSAAIAVAAALSPLAALKLEKPLKRAVGGVRESLHRLLGIKERKACHKRGIEAVKPEKQQDPAKQEGRAKDKKRKKGKEKKPEQPISEHSSSLPRSGKAKNANKKKKRRRRNKANQEDAPTQQPPAPTSSEHAPAPVAASSNPDKQSQSANAVPTADEVVGGEQGKTFTTTMHYTVRPEYHRLRQDRGKE